MPGRNGRQSGRGGGKSTGSFGRGQGKVQRAGRGENKAGQSGVGSVQNCVCSNCDFQIAHTPSQPCNQIHCPKCGTLLIKS